MIWKIAALIMAGLSAYGVLMGLFSRSASRGDGVETLEECRKCGVYRTPGRLCGCEKAPTP